MNAERAIEILRAEYTRAIGPMAHVLVDEALTALGAAPGELPLGKLPELIEKLSWEIQSERRRALFQKQALAQLQDLG